MLSVPLLRTGHVLESYLATAPTAIHTTQFKGRDRDNVIGGWNLGNEMVLLESKPDVPGGANEMILARGARRHVLKPFSTVSPSGDSERSFGLVVDEDDAVVVNVRPDTEGGIKIEATHVPKRYRIVSTDPFVTTMTGAALTAGVVRKMTADWVLSSAHYTRSPNHIFNPSPTATPENSSAILLVPADSSEKRLAILIRRRDQDLIKPEDIQWRAKDLSAASRGWVPVNERWLGIVSKDDKVITMLYVDDDKNNKIQLSIDRSTGKLKYDSISGIEGETQILPLEGEDLEDYGLLE